MEDLLQQLVDGAAADRLSVGLVVMGDLLPVVVEEELLMLINLLVADVPVVLVVMVK
jgi:predicted transcriptional regulator